MMHLRQRACKFGQVQTSFFNLSNYYSFNIGKRRVTSDVKEKIVFVSKSNNIFENLALEDWLYQKFDFENKSLLFMWINQPCAVIGRHQNPWVEVNLQNLLTSTACLSRRNSGGGTVYHDMGNLNCTFFSSRIRYKRKSNLEIICKTLKDTWDLNVGISPREDIVLNNLYKVSGTASKLGHRNAYHHCTLLVDVDSKNLTNMLHPTKLGIQSNSTASVRSDTLSLKACCPHITIEDVIKAIGSHFMHSCTHRFEDFKFVNPEERDFPGIDLIKQAFSSWNWIYGKTPHFTIKWPIDKQETEINIDVHQGKVEKIHFQNNSINRCSSNKLTKLLLNQKLDTKLYEDVLKDEVFSEISGDGMKLKEFLLSISSTTVSCE